MNIEGLRELEQGATPGPWTCEEHEGEDGLYACADIVHDNGGVAMVDDGFRPFDDHKWRDDAILIAAMRNALPALLDVAVSASQARHTLRAMLDHDELDSEAVRDVADLLDTFLARLEGGDPHG